MARKDTELGAAIEAGDFPRALAAALDRWRAARHPVLAELIDVLALRCERLEIRGRDKTAYQREWLQLARARPEDAVATGALVAGLGRSLPIRDISYQTPGRDVKRYRPLLERVTSLAAMQDDPRTATAIVELLTRAAFALEEAEGVLGPVVELLVRIGDERCIAALRALVDPPVAWTATLREHPGGGESPDTPAYFARALPRAAHAIERGLARRRALREPERVTLEALLATLGAPSARPGGHPTPDSARHIAALLAACLEDPDDTGPRLVLADALLERGDPRGAFISLQLRDDLEPVARKRMAALIRQHDKQWLGDLARVTKLRVFRHGFLEQATLVKQGAADPATWARVASDPMLATIRVLHQGRASEELYRSFAFSPAMRSLRDITAPSTQFLGDLATIGRRLEHLTLEAGLITTVLDPVAEATGVSRVTFVARWSPRDCVEQVASWPGRSRFEEICVGSPPSDTATWGAEGATWLAALDQLAPVRRLALDLGTLRCSVERGERGLRVDVIASHPWGMRMLQGLPAIEHLVIRGKPRITRRTRERLDVPCLGSVELRDGWEQLLDPGH